MRKKIAWSVASLMTGILVFAATVIHTNSHEQTASYIVQSNTAARARALILDVGGEITHDLGIVRRIADRVELFLVVTSDYSSNGMRLLELADDLTGNAKRIETVKDIRE